MGLVTQQYKNTFKKKTIYLPSNYITVTEEARTKLFQYEAKWINYDFFTNYAVSVCKG